MRIEVLSLFEKRKKEKESTAESAQWLPHEQSTRCESTSEEIAGSLVVAIKMKARVGKGEKSLHVETPDLSVLRR